MKLAPIILFVYNRPWHTQQTIEALAKNVYAKESELFIYADGAKDEEAKQGVDEVRAYIKSIDGFKKITIIERDKNWGLADNIIDGVTKIVNEHGKIIVLEDDIVTSEYFLKFMNEALEFYEKEQKVHSITGYLHIKDNSLDAPFFLKLTSSWSWATWADRWNLFKKDDLSIHEYLQNDANKREFNFNNTFAYTKILDAYFEKKVHSWAIWFHYSMLKNQLVTLYPHIAFVKNIGFDGSGTNCADGTKDETLFSSFESINFPSKIIIHEVATKLHEEKFLKK